MTPGSSWVMCPICRESSMPCVTDAEGWTLIRCTNHFCRSNRLIDAAPPVKDIDAAIEVLGGTTGLEKTSQGQKVLAQMRRIFDPMPEQPAGWDTIKTAMLSADLRQTRGSRKWCEVFASALREAEAGQGTPSAAKPAVAGPQALLEGIPVAEPKPFALVLDRFMDGDVDLAVLQADGHYLFSDGDLHTAEGDMLGMWEAEFFTQHGLEIRMRASESLKR